jgi:uroporphyrin-III C-methyltransferase/precorrin-2 dehydrogenase/sirohydrochlorin ferrochelatase
MDYFPLFLKLKQQHCLVIGAGEVAARKIDLLARTGAIITVIATEISPAVADMQSKHNLLIKQKSIETADIHGFRLVISATNNSNTNQLVANTATEHNIPVNVVDNPALCSFIFPAIIDRSPVIAAVSSGGSSPVLARLLRAKIESIIPPAFGQLAHLAEKYRNPVKQQIKQPAQRRIFWENVLQGGIAELVFSGKKQEAENQLKNLISNTVTTETIEQLKP